MFVLEKPPYRVTFEIEVEITVRLYAQNQQIKTKVMELDEARELFSKLKKKGWTNALHR